MKEFDRVEFVKPTEEIFNYIWAHIRELDAIEFSRAEYNRDYFKDPTQHPVAVLLDGEPIMLMGYSVDWNAVNMWGCGTEKLNENKKLFFQMTKSYCQLLREEHPHRVIQLAVREEDEMNKKWHRALGFYETDMCEAGLRWMRFKE